MEYKSKLSHVYKASRFRFRKMIGRRDIRESDEDLVNGKYPFYYASSDEEGGGSSGESVTVSAPSISVSGNTVTLTAGSGATIYYTIDGSVPTSASTKYEAPFAITSDCTIKARAYIGSTASSVTVQAVSYTATGSADDPITYKTNSTVLTLGSYYIENGVTYLCISSASSVLSISLADYIKTDEGKVTVTALTGENIWSGIGLVGDDNVAFENPSGLVITSSDGKNFSVIGELAEMTEEQSLAFWGSADYVGSRYLSFYIKDLSASNPVVTQGWVNDVESTTYKDQKSGSTDPGTVLALTLGSTLRTDLDGCYIWKCQLTDGEIYTVDLTAQAAALSGASQMSILSVSPVEETPVEPQAEVIQEEVNPEEVIPEANAEEVIAEENPSEPIEEISIEEPEGDEVIG